MEEPNQYKSFCSDGSNNHGFKLSCFGESEVDLKMPFKLATTWLDMILNRIQPNHGNSSDPQHDKIDWFKALCQRGTPKSLTEMVKTWKLQSHSSIALE